MSPQNLYLKIMTIHDILQEIRLKALTEKQKGTDFERLMKLWFLTDPRYNNLEKVWLWEEFSARKDFGGKDLGIDLVARTEYGDYWAIQCKCYAWPMPAGRSPTLRHSKQGNSQTWSGCRHQKRNGAQTPKLQSKV